MSKMEYLDFSAICRGVRFKDVLDFLNIPSTQERPGQLKFAHNGTFYIVTLFGEMTDEEKTAYKEKNGKDAPAFDMYKNTKTEKGGSCINFLMEFNPELKFRDAAATLKHTFMNKPKEETTEKKPFSPDDYAAKLQYDHPAVEALGLDPETARSLQIGYQSKGILKGRVAVRVKDAFIGRATSDEQADKSGLWFFPKGFKTDTLWNLDRIVDEGFLVIVADIFEAVHLSQFGLPAVALMSLSMNSEQTHLAESFRKILLIHPKPENIAQRLALHSYIMAPKLPKRVRDMTAEDLARYLV